MARGMKRTFSAALACVLAAGCWICAPAAAVTGALGAAPGGQLAAQAAGGGEGSQLESAAHKAGETGRRVAMSLIALGFAIAAIVLAFRRDFKEAVGVFAIGVIAVLLAQQEGVTLVENLVHSLFGT